MIPFVSFEPMHDENKEELRQAYETVMASAWFIKGRECTQFEEEFASYCGAKYCVGCGNGLDALFLILKAYGIGEGDEVIHSFQYFYCNRTGSILYGGKACIRGA